ncbi:3122_t:CDS:2 [Racocetra persica]|uniref:3122_t:CDS:1 n=1 Tax=Racocetra persica TaxID=160502 RepID=A0ACA9PLB1_9GLOM|nr:3122_t:CDS:2 [Racocetra persica]
MRKQQSEKQQSKKQQSEKQQSEKQQSKKQQKDEEKANKSVNIFNCTSNSSVRTNLILEDIVNLQDPIFQERDILYETSNDNLNNNIENSINIDLNPEELIDTILNNELDY